MSHVDVEATKLGSLMICNDVFLGTITVCNYALVCLNARVPASQRKIAKTWTSKEVNLVNPKRDDDSWW